MSNRVSAMRAGLFCALLLGAVQGRAQEPTPTLSPSEAFASAMAPFNAARAQADDLTSADTVALSVGMVHAGRDCSALLPRTEAFASDAAQLLALSRLCIFGQQYEAARGVLVRYLALPRPPEREPALLLLVRALLGLKAPGSAQPQVLSLLRDYPYDVDIHLAADGVIDATEGVSEHFNQLALELCAKQNAATLPLLASGRALPGKGSDASLSGSVLFADALRCATLEKRTGDISATDTMRQLGVIAHGSAWRGSAELAPIEEALARAEMVGHSSPVTEVHGHALSANGALLPRTVPLGHGTVVLVPFTLWSPSAASVLRDLAASLPKQTVYAVTSWAANTGGNDKASAELLAGLRAWRQSVPPQVPVLIVPDAVLSAFHADAFPATVALHGGAVVANGPIASAGAIRLLLLALQAKTGGSSPAN